MPKEVAAATLDFYAPLTDPDGPAMTDSVHAIDAAAIGEPGCATYTYLMRSIRPFVREPFAQFAEARGAKAGVVDPHSGAPALTFTTGSGGFTQVFTHGLTGLRLREDRVVPRSHAAAADEGRRHGHRPATGRGGRSTSRSGPTRPP